MEDERRDDGRNTTQSCYNFSISIRSNPSFLPLHSSFSASQLSLPPSPTPVLIPLCSCLFRLGWDKWMRMNTLGTWGSRRAECEGQGEERGGGGVTWTRRDWLVRKIKPSRWWCVMNGSHYEWLAKRGAGCDVWKKIPGVWGSNGTAEMIMTNDVGGFLQKRKEEGATAISKVQWRSKAVFRPNQVATGLCSGGGGVVSIYTEHTCCETIRK